MGGGGIRVAVDETVQLRAYDDVASEDCDPDDCVRCAHAAGHASCLMYHLAHRALHVDAAKAVCADPVAAYSEGWYEGQRDGGVGRRVT